MVPADNVIRALALVSLLLLKLTSMSNNTTSASCARYPVDKASTGSTSRDNGLARQVSLNGVNPHPGCQSYYLEGDRSDRSTKSLGILGEIFSSVSLFFFLILTLASLPPNSALLQQNVGHLESTGFTSAPASPFPRVFLLLRATRIESISAFKYNYIKKKQRSGRSTQDTRCCPPLTSDSTNVSEI